MAGMDSEKNLEEKKLKSLPLSSPVGCGYGQRAPTDVYTYSAHIGSEAKRSKRMRWEGLRRTVPSRRTHPFTRESRCATSSSKEDSMSHPRCRSNSHAAAHSSMSFAISSRFQTKQQLCSIRSGIKAAAHRIAIGSFSLNSLVAGYEIPISYGVDLPY